MVALDNAEGGHLQVFMNDDVLIDIGEIPASAAIFLSERLGSRDILNFTLFTRFLVRLNRGRPRLGSLSTLPFNENF